MKSTALLLALVLAVAAGQAAPAFAAANDLHHHRTKARNPPAKAKVRAAPRPAIDYDGEQVDFGEWQAVRDFEDDMVARNGYDRDALRRLVGQARFIDSAVQLVKPAPPGKPKNWQAYSERFIEPIRINAGVRFWNENAQALARAEATYGVPAEIIVGILGVETIYGRDTGKFRIVDVLTTLAFSYPDTPNRADRMAFFRGELENTLLLARKENIDPFSLLGSFAGGQYPEIRRGLRWRRRRGLARLPRRRHRQRRQLPGPARLGPRRRRPVGIPGERRLEPGLGTAAGWPGSALCAGRAAGRRHRAAVGPARWPPVRPDRPAEWRRPDCVLGGEC
jgi:hypothetical protein